MRIQTVVHPKARDQRFISQLYSLALSTNLNKRMRCHYINGIISRNVTVRPLSTVEYTRVASVFHSRPWSTNLIHDRCSCTLFTLSSVSSSACLFHAWKLSSRGEFCCCYYLYSRCQLAWMCPLKR